MARKRSIRIAGAAAGAAIALSVAGGAYAGVLHGDDSAKQTKSNKEPVTYTVGDSKHPVAASGEGKGGPMGVELKDAPQATTALLETPHGDDLGTAKTIKKGGGKVQLAKNVSKGKDYQLILFPAHGKDKYEVKGNVLNGN